MKKEKNLISTKDELVKNFTPEQLEIFEYYKSKLSYNDLVPVKEDNELIFMEKTYGVLQKVFKIEMVFALIVATIVVISSVTSNKEEPQLKYVPVAKVIEENFEVE